MRQSRRKTAHPWKTPRGWKLPLSHRWSIHGDTMGLYWQYIWRCRYPPWADL